MTKWERNKLKEQYKDHEYKVGDWVMTIFKLVSKDGQTVPSSTWGKVSDVINKNKFRITFQGVDWFVDRGLFAPYFSEYEINRGTYKTPKIRVKE